MKILNEKKVEDILKSKKIKLNLGCGEHNWADYICIDLNPDISKPDIVGDITELYMFANDSVEEVSCYHVIEHLGHKRVTPFFQEIYRVLKTGGKFILECPNLNAVIEKFASIRFNSGEIKGDFGKDSAYETLYGGQGDSGSFHLCGFNRYILMCLLKNVGFEELKITPEIPKRGVEYGLEWNLRLIAEK